MNMSNGLKRDWLPKLQARYARRNREGKTRMLDDLCDDYQYERKYAIKLLSGGLAPAVGRDHPGPERRYREIQALVQYIWLLVPALTTPTTTPMWSKRTGPG